MRFSFGRTTNLTGGFYFATLMQMQNLNRLSDKQLAAMMNFEFNCKEYNETRIRLYRNRYNSGKLNKRTKKPSSPVPRFNSQGWVDNPRFGPKQA